jgi:hypothetical protein
MVSRRKFLGLLPAGFGWSFTAPALFQSVAQSAWSFDFDAEADVITAVEIPGAHAAIVIGTRDRVRPAFYSSLDLVYFNSSLIQRVDLTKVFGEFRAPIRYLALDPNGALWIIRQPSANSPIRKPGLVTLERGGQQSTRELEYEWSPQAVITGLAILPSRRVICAFRNSSQSVLVSLLPDGTSKVRSYARPDGFYYFVQSDERTVMAVSGELSSTRSAGIVSTLRILDQNMNDQATGSVEGWVRDVEFDKGDMSRSIVLTTASPDDDRSFRVEELSISQGQFRSVSANAAEGNFVPGSLGLRGNQAQVSIVAVRSADSSLIASRVKETSSAQPLRKLSAEGNLLVKTRWLKSGERLSLVQEELTRVGDAVRKRVSLLPSTEISRILGSK